MTLADILSRGITEAMTILGIDPGTARIGWGIIETKGSLYHTRAFGLITTERNEAVELRLLKAYHQICKICVKYAPDVVSIEELFFATNAKTAIAVGQARGILLLSAAANGIPVYSYSPLAVKRAITGDGHADKKQVLKMIVSLLKLKEPPKPDDVADALAIALAHVYSYRIKERMP